MERNYGWVIVAAGAFITCVAFGAMFALPVYLQPIAEDTGWTRAGISGAMTIGFIVMGVAGLRCGRAQRPHRRASAGAFRRRADRHRSLHRQPGHRRAWSSSWPMAG